MHRLQVGVFAVFVAGAIVGTSALATQATVRIDQSTVSSSSTRSTASPDSVKQSELAQLPKAAQPTVSEIEVPNPKNMPPRSTSAAVKTTTPPVACDQALRQAAKDTQARRTMSETARHQQILRTLQNTGLVTRFLNPNMTGTACLTKPISIRK